MPQLAQQAGEIPDKLYFRIGEVSRLVGVKPFVLRYWESEFSALAPKKSGAKNTGTGHRLYRRKDVELALEIKRLLYDNRYTIEGARNFLASRTGKKAPPPPAPPVSQSSLFESRGPALELVRKELRAILDLLGP